jgi:hypothetical protein
MSAKDEREKLLEQLFEVGLLGHDAGRAADFILADRARLLRKVEEAGPEDIDEGEGWEIYFEQADEVYAKGKIVRKGKVRSCCPGDDIAYAHNMASEKWRAALQSLRISEGVE